MAGRLVVLDRAGRAKSKSFVLGSGMCTLGRSAACDIRVLLPEVSPHHATVTVHANQTVVRNVGSGTTEVNGTPVSVCALQHGDELDICGRKLRWEYDTPQALKRNKTQPALALPTAPSRGNRRGTMAAPPRAPDRDVQLALELRHRASMPASSGAGGKQVAIVQPQRRNTDNQSESTSPRLVVSPHRPYRAHAQEPGPPAPAPAPRKAASARLHTPTKATLWIESRRGRARASSLRSATPLRLAVLRKALTPAPRTTKVRVTKIQAPLRIDHTKQAAIMLMTGHTPKSKLPSPKTPTFVAKKRSPATRTPKGRSTLNASSKSTRSTPQALVSDTPEKSTRKSNKRNLGKQSVSVLEITDSETSFRRSPALPHPPKSALKSGRSRKTESIKFDLSNLENHSEDDDILMVSSTTRDATEDVTLRYSSSPPSPSPRRSIHSRSERMLESLGSPLRSPARTRTSAPASPASPRSLKSARGSIIVQKALESSDTFVTEYSNKTGSPRRRDLEAYSVVDLVSLDSDTSRSVYGSAGSPSRSGFGASTPLVTRTAPMDGTMTTPENAPRAPSQSTRKSRGARSRSRLDDSTRTIDSIEDDSPKSSRKLVKSASKRSRSLNDSYPESPQTYISLDSSYKSLGNLSTTAKRGSRSQLNTSNHLLESPNNISIESMKKSLSRVLSASKRSPRTRDNTLEESPKGISPRKSLAQSPTKRSSRGNATVTLGSPKDNISIGSLKESLGKKLSSSHSRSRLDDSSVLESPEVTAHSTRKSLGNTLSASKRGSRSQIDNITFESSVVSAKSSRKTSGKSPVASPENVSVNSTRKSAGKSPFPTKRSSRSPHDSITPLKSPKANVSNASRKSAGKTPSPSKGASRSQLNNTASPKSRTLSASKRSSRSQVDSVLSSPTDLTDSTRKSTEQSSVSKRGSRSNIIDSVLSRQLDNLSDSTRRSLGKTLSVSKRGSRSQLVETILSSPETEALADSTRKSLGKTPKRGSRSYVESILSPPDGTNNSTRRSTGKSHSASKRGSRSKIIDSVLSPQLDVLADSTRKSIGKRLSASKRGSRSQVIVSVSPKLDALSDSKRASLQADSPFNSPNVLADSTRKSLGKTPKRGSRSQLDSSVTLESPKANNSTRKSAGKTLSTSTRNSRSKLIDSVLSPQLDVLSDPTRKSLGKSLSTTKRGSRNQLVEIPSPRDFSTRKSAGKSPSPSKRSQLNDSVPTESPKNTSRKSGAETLSTSSRRTRSLPIESPKNAKKLRVSAISTSKRSIREVDQSPVVSPRGNVSPQSRKSAKSPSNTPLASPKVASPSKSPKSPAKSPATSPAISPKVSKARTSRKTLTVSITRAPNETVTDGEVTPEERGSPQDAGTPILSIRSLLDATVSESPGEPPRKRGRISAVEKRKTFAAQNAPRNARGSIRSKSLILVRGTGDVTPTGVAEPTPEAVKSKHSSAKKSRSRRSIIDNLDDSGLVKHLFNSPVKRKLSQSMSEFSRRLQEHDETSPDVSGVKRLLTKKSPRNELKDFNGVRRLMRTPRARRSIKNDLTDVAGVKVMFAAAPRDSFGDVRGIKRAFQASPKDDLRQVSGVKSLFNKKKPRDDLSDVRGVRQLFQRGPRNELNASGVKDALQVKSPKNDLRDVRGVKKLFRQSKSQTSPNVSGVAMLLDEPAPAEVMFDQLVGKPPVRATYSKTFIARSAQKPAKRRRTTSLNVDVIVNDVEGWLEKELQKRVGKPVNRELQKLATATVAGGTPILSSRSRNSVAPRRSAAENYAEHTLPIKKRSLEKAPESRSAKKKSLPLKKRALVHSTPVKGRASRAADVTLARMSPIAVEPALTSIQEPAAPVTVEESKEIPAPKPVAKPATPKKSPTPKKATRGKKILTPTQVTPKKATRAKKALTPTKVTPKKATRAKKALTPTKVTPKKATRAKKVLTPTKVTPKKATRAKKVLTPKKVTPKKATRGKKVATPTASPEKAPTPKKATRAKKVLTPAKTSPKKSPTPKKATRAKRVLTPKAASPKKPPTPKATRSKKVNAATPKKTAAKTPTVVVKKPRVVVAASPKPSRGAKKAVTKSPHPKSPATKQSKSKKAAPSPAPVVEKRSRKQAAAASPAKKKAVRVSLVLPKPSPVLKPQPAARPKRSKIEPKQSSKKAPTRAKNPAAGDAPAARGRKAAVSPQKGKGKASPKKATPQKAKATPEPKKDRRAPATTKYETSGKTTKAPTPKGKTEVPATPEPRRKGRKAPATPEAKKKSVKATPEPTKGRKAAASPKATPEPRKKGAKAIASPEPKKGRKTAAKQQVEEPVPKRGRKTVVEDVKSPPAPRRAARKADPAPKETAKSKGKKVTIVEPKESPPRGRKRKNDSSVDKKKEPSPKKPRASRAATAPAAAAAAAATRRRR
ncbi:serine/arginine repetitive matrix protein 2-like [Cydia splendana]|uniref:serine/arginine repetitive matrix protein 2-like n=1 Tax=Cydia splendana TaxID=1100963 RepID=UPI0028F46864